jgi:YVTN family beta-propeller protein
MALNPTNGLLYVTDGASNAVSVLNATTDAVVATVPTGSQPHGIAYDPDDGKMYVANWGSNDISVISGTPGRVASTVYLGNGTPSPAPFGVAFDSWNGGVYVTNCNGCAGTVLNGTTGAAGQFPTGPSPAFPTFDPENGLLYVPNAARSGSVTIVDGRTNAVLSTLPAGQNPITAAYDPDTGELYVPNYSGNTVTVIDGTAYDESVSFGAVSAPRYPVAFAENGLPAGSKWTVTLGGVTYVSSGGTVVASEPNGTYAFSVAPAGAYAPRPATGSVAVRGGPVSQTIGFAPRTHSVRFAESGLPAGHAWSVTFGTTSRTATGPSLAFAEANGSYSFQVRPEAGYTAIPARGTVRIDGQNLTVRVQFTPAGSPGTGGGQGSVSWPVWVGALGLPAWVLAAVVAVAVAVPLFFLARRRRRRSPTTVPPPDTDWSPGPGADDGASEAIATEGGPSLA